MGKKGQEEDPYAHYEQASEDLRRQQWSCIVYVCGVGKGVMMNWETREGGGGRLRQIWRGVLRRS